MEAQLAAVGAGVGAPAGVGAAAVAFEVVGFGTPEAVGDHGVAGVVGERAVEAAGLGLAHDAPFRVQAVPGVGDFEPAGGALRDHQVLAPGETAPRSARAVEDGDERAGGIEFVAHEPVGLAVRIDEPAGGFGERHAREAHARVARAAARERAVGEAVVAPGAVGDAGEKAVRVPLEGGAVAVAVEAGDEAVAPGARGEVEVLAAGLEEVAVATVALGFGHGGPAPAPGGAGVGLGHDGAGAAQPQGLGRREAGFAGGERAEGEPPALGVDEDGGLRPRFEPEPFAGEGPALAEAADARIAREVAAREDEGGRGGQREVGLGGQELGAHDGVHRPAHLGGAHGALVGCAFGGVADEHRGGAGDDLALGDLVADAGGGFATHGGNVLRR